ncbi:MAG: hypothetical protein CSA64_00520 [Arachnia propionica]|nr:MAG: hypothetical protein CSA64_00520 [Arachnia propionica]
MSPKHRRPGRQSLTRSSWFLGSLLIAAVVALPLGAVLWGLLAPATDAWRHIQDTLLLRYIGNTLWLLLGSLAGAVAVGSALAWFVTAYDFPGRRWLTVGLVLPIAIPPYIGASTYASIVGYTGPIQVWLRRLSIEVPPGSLDIMNTPGAIAIFTLFLYPYVYLVVRGFLHLQAGQLVEAAAMLGSSRAELYWRIVLPLTRPAVVAGGTLVAFEVLSDYGVVSYYGLHVFSTAIFKSWQGLHDISSAMKLSALLLVVVTLVLVGERTLRGSGRYSYASPRIRPLAVVPATGLRRVLIVVITHGVFWSAIIIPVAQMIYWAVVSWHSIDLKPLAGAWWTSLWLGLVGAALTTVFAVIVTNHRRLWPDWASAMFSRIAALGYSIPSTVIALSILSIFVGIEAVTGKTLVLSPVVVVLAYLVRYLAVSLQSVESGFERIGKRYTESARMLGNGPWRALLRVDAPLLRAALLGAFLLSFIDIVKELPIVLILRPFNFTTLSTTVFQYAHDEMIPESSLASLLIIVLTIIPTAIIMGRRVRSDAASPAEGGQQ